MAKSKKRGGRRQRGRRKTNVGSGELRWIGGRAALPGAVSEGGKLLRLDWMMWVEAPSGLIVGHGLVPSAEPAGPVADLLLDAMEKPFTGSPRRPDRVTVASTALGKVCTCGSKEAAGGDGAEIVVARGALLGRLAHRRGRLVGHRAYSWSGGSSRCRAA
jgi:hypothetical protein